jgi:phage replication O-like protein O
MVSGEKPERVSTPIETHPVFLLRISSQINDREAKVDMGFTKVDNRVIDHWMKWLPGESFKVLLALIRKTVGFHEETTAAGAPQLAAMTGLTIKTVRNTINYLEEEGVIRKVKSKRTVRTVLTMAMC